MSDPTKPSPNNKFPVPDAKIEGRSCGCRFVGDIQTNWCKDLHKPPTRLQRGKPKPPFQMRFPRFPNPAGK